VAKGHGDARALPRAKKNAGSALRKIEKKMFPSHPQTYLGYDPGTDSAKAVTIRRQGQTWQVTGCYRLKYEDEGISSTADQTEALSAWCRQHHWENLPSALALPQYQGASVLKDFPPVPARKLPMLVAGEAKSLSGVSEESFLWDYRPLPPANGRRNPVLVSLCRIAAPTERLRSAWPQATLPRCLSLAGQALAEAFAFLQPAAAASDQPQLLLDLGHDNTTAVLWCAGQPLYFASLTVVAGQFAEAANRALGADQRSRLENLRNFRLTDELDSSPAGRLACQLDSELQDFVAAWRDQELPDLAQRPVAGIWLSGGGAMLGGLRDWLQRSSETIVQFLQPVAPGLAEEEAPLYTIALGLALQAAGGRFGTRLFPEAMLDKQRHQASIPLLWAALALLILSLAIFFTANYFRCSQKLRDLRRQIAQLQECGEIIPQLENANAALKLQDTRLLPLLVASQQTDNFRKSLAALGQACQQEEFPVFLADQPQRDGQDDTKNKRSLPVLTADANCKPPTAYYCQGFAPLVPLNRYEKVRALTDRLNHSGLFTGADLSQDPFPDSAPAQKAWLKFLRQYGDKDYLEFALILPLAK